MPTHTPAPAGDGQLPTTKTAIITGTVGTQLFLKRLTMFNTNAATQTVELWINYSGTSRAWRRYTLAQYESADALDPGETVLLDGDDTIEARTTTAAAVDWSADGIVRAP
jgi:hypothetical protein